MTEIKKMTCVNCDGKGERQGTSCPRCNGSGIATTILSSEHFKLRTTSERDRKLFEQGTVTMSNETTQESNISIRRQLLLDAADTIDGDRNETYGGPEQSFAKIADFWNTYLGWSDMITPQDVAAMLALLKIARISGSAGSHKDSWLDLAGYAACGWECVES